jgi:hypothetical protein
MGAAAPAGGGQAAAKTAAAAVARPEIRPRQGVLLTRRGGRRPHDVGLQ